MKLSNFKKYDCDSPHGANVVHLKCDEGHDWYDIRKKLDPNSWKVCYHSNGMIGSISKDYNNVFPYDMSVIEVYELPEGFDPKTFDFFWNITDGKIMRDYSRYNLLKQKKETDSLVTRINTSKMKMDNNIDTENATRENKELVKKYLLVSGLDISKPIEWDKI